MNELVRGFFAKAEEDLSDAEKIFEIGLLKPAARSAYYSCFHSCEGFIFHKTGKISKTHSGVRSEFARLTKDIPGFDRSLTSFLAQAYTFKEMSDYGIWDHVSLSVEGVEHILKRTRVFLDTVRALVDVADE